MRASVCFVMSSFVGPRPPVQITTSERFSASPTACLYVPGRIGDRCDPVDSYARRVELLAQPGRVRVDDLSDQDFVAYGNDFCLHKCVMVMLRKRCASEPEALCGCPAACLPVPYAAAKVRSCFGIAKLSRGGFRLLFPEERQGCRRVVPCVPRRGSF